jgi:hypothetical protein
MLPIIISLIFMCEFAIPTLLFSIVNTQWRWKVLVIIMILFFFLFNWQLSFYQFSFCQMNHKRWFWWGKQNPKKFPVTAHKHYLIFFIDFRVKNTKYHLFLLKLSFMVMINYYSWNIYFVFYLIFKLFNFFLYLFWVLEVCLNIHVSEIYL